jgi:SAM-dependent methyltransferase
MTESHAQSSAEQIVARFDTPAAALKYSSALNGTPTHRREIRCILQALHGVGPGASLLDLPCGAARLLPELARAGFIVTSADSSPNMIELAWRYAQQCGIDAQRNRFIVANALQTPFADRQFQAVVCNRLLHHFPDSATRQRALHELARICSGPIVVSFFCSQSLDGAFFHLKDALRGRIATDRIPISRSVFEADVRAAGLEVDRWLPTRPGISKQWYAQLRAKR